MNLQTLVSGPGIVRAGMFLSQHTPERIGHGLAWWLAGLICRLRPAVYKIVQANLSQVLQGEATRSTLERTTREVFCSAIRGYYDLYRAVRPPLERLSSFVDLPEATRAITQSLCNRERGSVLVFPHLASFDLGGHAIVPRLPQMQLLTLPDPPPGFEMANKLRTLTGARVTPLSSAALRQAIKLLRMGGVVSLAGDRPVSELDEPVLFFNRPARVPSGPVRLALKTEAVVAVAYCVLLPETQRYSMNLEPPMEMVRTGDADQDVRFNMRRVLDALEQIIRRWPGQWQMFVPVWPELMEARG
jgi:lauroyl/myristoyl acyltransferase